MAPLLERFKHDIRGISWLALAVLLALSLFSFRPTDPSLNSAFFGGAHHVANWCGYFGSFLSDILYQLLGVAAWVVVATALRFSVLSFKSRNPRILSWQTLIGFLFVVVVSSLLGVYFPKTRIFAGHAPLAGIVGLVVSQALVHVFSIVGVAIILWASAAVLLVFYTEKRLIEIARWFRFLQPLGARLKASLARAFEKKETAPIVTQKSFTSESQQLAFVENKPQFSLNEVIKTALTPRLSTIQAQEKIQAAQLKKVMAQRTIQVENWNLPSLDLLSDPAPSLRKVDEREISRNARLVEQKLAEFDVHGQVTEVIPGPAVTMYEFKPAASVKINDITKLADDLSLALSAESLRIIAPIPGRDVVGIETSNSTRDSIAMKELLESPEFWSAEMKLPLALGKSVNGDPKIVDLRKIPHLLVAGTTGSGKSVFTMSVVTSLIMRHSPKTLRLVLIDPKQVDLAAFHQIPHLLLPPVKEAKPAVSTLKWLIREMEKRYRSMSQFNAKNIEGFNEATSGLKSDERASHEEKNKLLEQNPQTAMQNYYSAPQPYIVAVIEEFADLMSVDRNGVEPAVVRLAQMARASGIHLVIAMQSPRREVLTGLIKTNFPGRISFKVASKVDSSIILDQRGAERLLSVGDMLYLAPGVSQPQRYHGAFLRDDEMVKVAQFWTNQGEPTYEPTALSFAEKANDLSGGDDDFMNPDAEEGYDEVLAFVSSQKEVSASLLQRRFRFGYPKAARLIEMMENEGVVSAPNGSKPRQVLVNKLG